MIVTSVAIDLNEPAVLMIAAAWALQGRRSQPSQSVFALLAGGFSGLLLLSKVSVGDAFVVMTAVTLVSLPGRRGG